MAVDLAITALKALQHKAEQILLTPVALCRRHVLFALEVVGLDELLLRGMGLSKLPRLLGGRGHIESCDSRHERVFVLVFILIVFMVVIVIMVMIVM